MFEDGRLVECALENTAVSNCGISTPVISFDPSIHDTVSAFIWNDKYEPIMNVKTITATDDWVDSLRDSDFEGKKIRISYTLFSETEEQIDF